MIKTNFEQNLELLLPLNAKLIETIRNADCADYSLCYTQKGELTQWDKDIFSQPYFFQTLFLYGIGLGDYYDVIKPWLKENPDHFLVILESDLAAVHRFLETSKAFEILSDPQVIFKVFLNPKDFEWGAFREDFDWIFWGFASRKCHYVTIPLYHADNQVHKILTQISMGIQDRLGLLYEALGRAKTETVPNFYSNLLELPNAYLGSDLFEEFANFPTIICGAGPSLAKQFSLLKELGDRALIIGAGSAMNALTRNGIEPHFGGGLDPTPTQKSRMMTNFAFEVPYFYANRFYHEALLEVHGPHLYVNLSKDSSRWYESAFQLSNNSLDEIRNSRSTTQFCLDIARHLGCSPAIFVGLDLAYTDSKRYAPGVTVHETDSEKEKKMVDFKEEAFKIQGLNGNEIYTNWAWVLEGREYADYGREHHYSLINATEGGYPIETIPNRSLKEVMESNLHRSYDIPNFIHAAIQSSTFSKFSSLEIREKIEKWKGILQNCSILCDLLIKELAIHHYAENERVKLAEKQLQELPFFEASFAKIIEIIDLGLGLDYYLARIKQGKDLYKVLVKRYACLKEILSFHLRAIDQSLGKSDSPCEKHETNLEDEELESSIKEPFSIENRYCFYYKTGELKGESFYLGNVLHGPSTFYAKNGNVVAKTWFLRGKRQGKTLQYYASGQIYSIQRFVDGKKHGKQTFYYPNGVVKTVMEYAHGELNGTVLEYYPNGQKKKEYNFSNNTLISEAH